MADRGGFNRGFGRGKEGERGRGRGDDRGRGRGPRRRVLLEHAVHFWISLQQTSADAGPLTIASDTAQGPEEGRRGEVGAGDQARPPRRAGSPTCDVARRVGGFGTEAPSAVATGQDQVHRADLPPLPPGEGVPDCRPLPGLRAQGRGHEGEPAGSHQTAIFLRLCIFRMLTSCLYMTRFSLPRADYACAEADPRRPAHPLQGVQGGRA